MIVMSENTFSESTVRSDVEQAPEYNADKVVNEEKAEVIAAYIEQHMEHSPSRNAGDIPELFKDYGDDVLDEEIADLWRWGIIEVFRNDDDEQEVCLSDFGNELHEKGVSDTYLDAKLGFVPKVDTGGPTGVRVLE